MSSPSYALLIVKDPPGRGKWPVLHFGLEVGR